MKQHYYSAQIKWTGNTGKGTAGYKTYQRNYDILMDGKPTIHGSSDPSFRGDKKRQNPEELFLASISSCHMLWYLHLCSEKNITVVDYKDNASAIMIEQKSGTGHFESVTLKPHVKIVESNKIELAEQLHKKANEMCFIANSCNFKIVHEPITVIQE